MSWFWVARQMEHQPGESWNILTWGNNSPMLNKIGNLPILEIDLFLAVTPSDTIILGLNFCFGLKYMYKDGDKFINFYQSTISIYFVSANYVQIMVLPTWTNRRKHYFHFQEVYTLNK